VPRLLVVHHTSSPALRAMLEAVVAGARDPELAEAGIDVVVSPALAATVPDVLAADAFVLGTPANIGYMSGALKHFFDQVYYPCLDAKAGAPYGLYVHGASDTTGAVRAVKSIASGLGWAEVVSPVVAIGPVGKDVERQCYELGATVAANLAGLPSGVTPGQADGAVSTSAGSWPRSCSSTMAAFRPGAPVIEPPGWVVAPVWYRPGIGIRCDAQPGAGRSAPDWATPRSPPWNAPCTICGFSCS